MTTKFTPSQIRLFLNAVLSEDRTADGSPPKTVLDRFLSFDLPDDLRYRTKVLKRQLESTLAPVDAQIRELYEVYQSVIDESTGADETDSETPADGDSKTTKKKAKTEDPTKVEERAEAKKKLEEDIALIENKKIEFHGNLILGTQIANPKNPLPEDLRQFLRKPGLEEEWLIPFTVDNLPTE